MTFDYRDLVGRIISRFGSRTAFAKELGISIQALSRKLQGDIGLSQKEIIHWCDLLEIDYAQIPLYFFTIAVKQC